MVKKNKSYRKTAGLLILCGGLILGVAAAYHGFRTFFFRLTSDFFYPYFSLPAIGRSYLSDQTLLMHSKYELASNLEALRKEYQLLAARYTTAIEAQLENNELRRLLQLEKLTGYDYVYAMVHTRNPLEWRARFTINRGANSGIKPGSLVLSKSRRTESDSSETMVMCGIVRHVSQHTAEVITLLGSEAIIAVRLNDSDATGFINADASSAIPQEPLTRLNFLPANRQYMVGEPVVTAGFEDNIPPGILIGNIAEIVGGNTVFDNRLYINALVSPAADFENIRFLVVLTRK